MHAYQLEWFLHLGSGHDGGEKGVGVRDQGDLPVVIVVPSRRRVIIATLQLWGDFLVREKRILRRVQRIEMCAHFIAQQWRR
jgi:hypothetical protein